MCGMRSMRWIRGWLLLYSLLMWEVTGVYKIEIVDSFTRKRLSFYKGRDGSGAEMVFDKLETAQDEVLRLNRTGGGVIYRVYDPMTSQDRPGDALPEAPQRPRAWGRFG